MKKARTIILSAIILVFTSCNNYKPIKANTQSIVTEISFECNLIDGDNDETILQPSEMYFNMLIYNNSTDTLYFGSSNAYGLMDYGYFVLVSSYDSFIFNTSYDYLSVIPKDMEIDISGWYPKGPRTLENFTANTKTKREEIYNKIKKYKLLFIPHFESYTSIEREHLFFPSIHTFDLDSVIVSYTSGGKPYLYFNFGDDENGNP